MIKNCLCASFYESKSIPMLAHTFYLYKALIFAGFFFFFFFGKRSYIYIVFALCTVAVICILFQLCFARLGWWVTNCIPQAPLPGATSGGPWQEMRRRRDKSRFPLICFLLSLGGVFGDCCVPATIPALEVISSSTAPAPQVAAGAQVGPTCPPESRFW